jgi:hypothetical protein
VCNLSEAVKKWGTGRMPTDIRRIDLTGGYIGSLKEYYDSRLTHIIPARAGKRRTPDEPLRQLRKGKEILFSSRGMESYLG